MTQHSQRMDGRATPGTETNGKDKKRVRGPRVSTYLSPLEARRLKALQRRLKCDASAVLREALVAVLDEEEASAALERLHTGSERQALRQLLVQATFLFQGRNWDPIVLPDRMPLEEHYNAGIASEHLRLIRADLHKLVLRVADLLVTMKAKAPSRPTRTARDASPYAKEGDL